MIVNQQKCDSIAMRKNTRLIECENIIRNSMHAINAIGQALIEIREARLYIDSHGTFEEYCKDQWDFSGRYARNLIGASKVLNNMSGTIVPLKEAQTRELSKLPAVDQNTVWQEAQKITGKDQPTAKEIKTVIDSKKPPKEKKESTIKLVVDNDHKEPLEEQQQPVTIDQPPEPQSFDEPLRIDHLAHLTRQLFTDEYQGEVSSLDLITSCYWTTFSDELDKGWFGNVFFKPDFSNKEMLHDIQHNIYDDKNNEPKSNIIIVPLAPETPYFKWLTDESDELCLPNKQLSLLFAEKALSLGRDFHEMRIAIFYSKGYAQHKYTFEDVFSQIGSVWK